MWIVGLILTGLLAAAGAIWGSKYDVLGALHMPRIPVDEGSIATGGAIALAVALVARACRIEERYGERHVDPARRRRLQVKPPRGVHREPQRLRRHAHRPRAEDAPELVRVEHGLRRDVERAAHGARHGAHVRITG